jgi:hypothetical protein
MSFVWYTFARNAKINKQENLHVSAMTAKTNNFMTNI